jgi:dTDP-glucose 4,6-dehydratase
MSTNRENFAAAGNIWEGVHCMTEKLLVTGGAGFIGSNFVLSRIGRGDRVLNLDKLTYAGNPGNLESIADSPNYSFVKGSIEDTALVENLLREFQPGAVVHFAAESHVDRSIHGPETFIQTNVVGTFRLLEAVLNHWRSLGGRAKEQFRFLHVSTDEVYGSLEKDEPAFSETTPYRPNSPYSASKAGSDHLVRAYHHTYGLPVLTTNCSNNYGPFQFPEKLIPLVILNARDEKPLPVYGDGLNVRDWLHVHDHCAAISEVLSRGRLGETYNIGGLNEKTNLDVVHTICDVMDELRPASRPRRELITFVKDRPGHDRRYAINCSKIQHELGWRPTLNFERGLRETVDWYLQNSRWIESVTSGEYRNWVSQNYATRG